MLYASELLEVEADAGISSFQNSWQSVNKQVVLFGNVL